VSNATPKDWSEVILAFGNGNLILKLDDPDNQYKNARRLAAAMNSCRGIPTDDIEDCFDIVRWYLECRAMTNNLPPVPQRSPASVMLNSATEFAATLRAAEKECRRILVEVDV